MILKLKVGLEMPKSCLTLSKNAKCLYIYTNIYIYQHNHLLTPVVKDIRNASQKKFFQGTLALFYTISRLIKLTVHVKHSLPYSLTNLSQHASAKSSLQQLIIPKSISTTVTCMIHLMLLFIINPHRNIVYMHVTQEFENT